MTGASNFSVSLLCDVGANILSVVAAFRRPKRTAASNLSFPEGEQLGWPTGVLGQIWALTNIHGVARMTPFTYLDTVEMIDCHNDLEIFLV